MNTFLKKITLFAFSLMFAFGGTFAPSFAPIVLAAPSATPSTNDDNRTNGWAHVDQLNEKVGSTDLEFVSTRSFDSCFEYRTDGDTSQQTSPTNPNTEITDGLYPYFCVNNSSRTKTIFADEYVEVRMVFGAEKDERFDWTRFDVAEELAVTNEQTGETFATLQEAIDDADTVDGNSIRINENLTVTSQVNVTKPLNIRGLGHTISADFEKTSNSNNAVFGIIGTDGVTLRGMTIDGTDGVNLHGVNVYESTGVLLRNVNTKNHDHSGVLVNGSQVTVENINTSGNGWHGINVDQGSEVTESAILTVKGTSNHDEGFADIYVDDDTKDVTINDINDQYDWTRSLIPGRPNDQVYRLKTSVDTTAPDNLSVQYNEKVSGDNISNGGVTDEEYFTFTLNADEEPTRWQLKYWNDIPSSSFNSEAKAWKVSDLSSRSSSLGVYNGSFTQGEGTHYFVFSACDAADNCSPYTSNFVVTYDLNPVSYPYGVITSPAADYDVVSGETTLTAMYDDNTPGDTDPVQWAVRFNSCSSNTIFGNVDGKTDVANWDNENFSFEFDADELDAGNYCFIFNPTDDAGETNVRETRWFTVEASTTEPEEPETPPASDSNPPTNSSSGSRVIGGRSFTAAPAAQPGRVLGAEAYNFTLLLKRGSRGPEVMELQKYLNEHGYNSGVVDGIFGPVTEGAVKLFQIANGLVPDGIVGPLTRAVLNAQA